MKAMHFLWLDRPVCNISFTFSQGRWKLGARKRGLYLLSSILTNPLPSLCSARVYNLVIMPVASHESKGFRLQSSPVDDGLRVSDAFPTATPSCHRQIHSNFKVATISTNEFNSWQMVIANDNRFSLRKKPVMCQSLPWIVLVFSQYIFCQSVIIKRHHVWLTGLTRVSPWLSNWRAD